MLLDAGTRSELLSLLPPKEASELAAALEISASGNPYGALDSLSIHRGTERARTLLGFFGLVELDQSPMPAAPSLKAVVPGYGSPIDYLIDEGYLAKTEFIALNY